MEMFLKGINKKEVIDTAGKFGRLFPSQYTVDQPSAMKTFYNLAVRPNHVEDAILNPDTYQHLLMSDKFPENVDDISLFVKKIVKLRSNDDYFLIVQTHRLGSRQIAQSAWRVYLNDIDASEASVPLDLLKLFVNKFGVAFLIEW